MRRVLVVGAGWYGCYAVLLLERWNRAHDGGGTGQQRFHIDWVDSHGHPFGGSSARNQNRLHRAFHYPRSEATRRECMAGYDRFLREFPDVSARVDRNLYVVARHGSALTYAEYESTFHGAVPFSVRTVASLVDDNRDLLVDSRAVQGDVLVVDERFIDPDVARAFFEARLETPCRRATLAAGDDDGLRFLSSTPYDWILNCTYGQWNPGVADELVYELCVGWIYRPVVAGETLNLIVMDGPFFSTFPWPGGRTLLTHVRYTPIRTSRIASDVTDRTRDEIQDEADAARLRAEADVLTYCPNFLRKHRYDTWMMATKCKRTATQGDADRSLYIHDDGDRPRHVRFIGGKISGIFSMEDYLRETLLTT